MHIKTLRRKIGEKENLIQTVRKCGLHNELQKGQVSEKENIYKNDHYLGDFYNNNNDSKCRNFYNIYRSQVMEDLKTMFIF